jgi:hypothetical protein
MDWDLVISRISIKKAKERVICQSLKHFINEGQWKVIFPCGFVEFSIIYAHTPSSDGSLRN